MIWVVFRLKRSRNTSNSNGLDDLLTQEVKKLKLSAEGRELSNGPNSQNNIEKSRNTSNYNGLGGFSA